MIDELGKVVAIHPESNCVDVVLYRTGLRLPAVRVLGDMATGQTGVANLHVPDCKDGFDSANTGKRDIVAAIAYYKEFPMVVGFMFPEVAECLFARNDFKVDRHASDVYSTIDADGNMETYHPSGTYLRIGTSPAHEDLTGKDYDAIWKIERNTQKAVHVHLVVANAGAVKATIDIDQNGNITISNAGNTQINTSGTLAAVIGGETSITTPKVTMTTSELMVTGKITANGTITDLAGSSGKSMSGMRATYNSHTHPENGNGGPTSAPNQPM
jgi:hypothetical protein